MGDHESTEECSGEKYDFKMGWNIIHSIIPQIF